MKQMSLLRILAIGLATISAQALAHAQEKAVAKAPLLNLHLECDESAFGLEGSRYNFFTSDRSVPADFRGTLPVGSTSDGTRMSVAIRIVPVADRTLVGLSQFSLVAYNDNVNQPSPVSYAQSNLNSWNPTGSGSALLLKKGAFIATYGTGGINVGNASVSCVMSITEG